MGKKVVTEAPVEEETLVVTESPVVTEAPVEEETLDNELPIEEDNESEEISEKEYIISLLDLLIDKVQKSENPFKHSIILALGAVKSKY